MLNQNVIIRDNMAGVFVGTLTMQDGKTWTARDVRKIHYWTKAAAVEGLATVGFGRDSRITPIVAEIQGFDAVQICLCTDAEHAALMAAPVWTP